MMRLTIKIRYARKIIVFCLIAEMTLFAGVKAQSGSYVFKQITTGEELTQAWITAVQQDYEGFMWFGTVDGLYRYDGYEFKTYRSITGDDRTLAGNYINNIFEDSNKNLWVTTSKGISVYDRLADKFHQQPDWAKINMEGISEGRNGEVFFGSYNGIFDIQSDLKTIHQYRQYPDSADQYNNNHIVLAEKNEVLFIGPYGVNTFDYQTKSIGEKIALPGYFTGNSINNLIKDYKGTYWISTREHGLFYYTKGEHSEPKQLIINKYQFTENSTVLTAMQSKDSVLWIGTENNGLILLNLRDFYNGKIVTEHLLSDNTEGSISNNSIYSIYQDRQNTVWIGTYSGLNLYNPVYSNFKHVKYTPGRENLLNNNIVNAFYEAGDKIWIATENGVNIYNRKTKKYTHLLHDPANPNSLSGDAIWAITRDKQGNFWIGTWGAGLNCYDPGSGRITRFLAASENPDALASNNIFSVITDDKGMLWIATMGGGLNSYNPSTGKFRRYLHDNSDSSTVSNNWVRQVYFDSQKRLWVSTYASLDLFNRVSGKFEHFFASETNKGALSDIFEDSKHHMWFGTETGLNLFDEKSHSFKKFKIEDGLPSNVIHSILEDEKGDLWIGTNNGISKFEHATDLPARPRFVNFDVRDGLQGNKFNRRSALKCKDGTMYFGGKNGFSEFNPSSIKQNTYLPPVVLTQLLLFNEEITPENSKILQGRSINLTNNLTLNYNQSVFTIKFAALNYIIPEKNHYKYLLKGFEQKWNNIGSRRSATYTNLDPGDYTLRVIASNNSEEWNNKGISLRIRILPPWYRTYWAYGIYFIFISAVILLFRKFIVVRIQLQQQIELQHMEKERLDQLNRMKTRFFTNISHEFRTPLTLIISPIESLISDLNIKPLLKQQLVMIQKNARRLLRLINQLMDISQIEADHLKLKVRRGDIVIFIREIVLLFKWLASQRNIEYIFDSEYECFSGYFDGDKMEKICYNLLSNAFKFTPAEGKIEVRLSFIDPSADDQFAGHFRIVVKDNGSGIPEADQGRIFEHFFRSSRKQEVTAIGSGVGLALVKGLVNVYGGDIHINSSENSGTEFIIHIPYERRFFKEEQIDDTLLAETPVTLDIVDVEHSMDHKSLVTEESERENTVEAPMVLIIEDNNELRTHLSEQFSTYYNVLEAFNGKEGLEKAINLSPDLIISDIRMPVMDGIELCRQIKNNENTSHIPVVLLTAKTSVDDRFEGLSIGADAYITKPFDVKILLATVKNLIDTRRQLREKYKKNLVIEASEIPITSVDEKFIKKAISIVEKYIADADFSVDTFSKEIGMSRSHLHRKFVSLTGHSPSGFIRTIRMKRAAQLLTKGQLTVSEILFEVGIKSRSYFTKSFKEQFGVLPTEFASENGQRTNLGSN